ncbi:hypothetical protein FJM67_05075 [Maribrevibacterium harenarium]|uniref:Uncharacterized protein n=1 Tax=Maribrevibacterium harenarium TaxID=2589817 RepID=A0A501WYI1_9GAMM|nr:hypothetical protein [Maribrevibacterium harenarium]TPE54319.1 hypothetical protein FJM67_05075 [Maribrevibacterium harenarium]
MKSFFSPWLLLLTPLSVVAQPLLWSPQLSLVPSVSDRSELSYELEVERFYNDENGYGVHQGHLFTAQYCLPKSYDGKVAACIGGERFSDHLEWQEKFTSTEFSGSQLSEYSQTYLSGSWEFNNKATLEAQLGRLDSGYANGLAKLQTEPFSVWVGQDSSATGLHGGLSVSLTDTDQHNVSLDHSAHLGPYAGASFNLFDHYISYQQQALNHPTVQTAQWQIRPVRSGVEVDIQSYSEKLDTQLYFDGVAVSQYDSWQSDFRRDQHYIGWRWDSAWLGVYRDIVSFDASTYLRLSDKAWNSVESGSVIEGALLSTIHAITGDISADSEFLALRLGRDWQWENVELSWDNLIGDIKISSTNKSELRIILLANQFNNGSDEFSDTLWVPKLTLNYQPNNWRLAYTFQQIIPFSEVRKLLDSPSDRKGGGDSTGSNTEQQKAKNWLWPQIGGYHQLTLSYQW